MHRTSRAILFTAAAVVALGGLVVLDREAHAQGEKVEAKQSADVFAAPGEQSRVVTRVRAGKEMVVLQTKNRWLKVRVNGRTGWITRSNVAAVELSEAAPRAKRRRPFVEGRTTRRGSRGKGPGDRVGGDATDEDIDDDDEAEPEDDDRSQRERARARAKRKKAQAKEMDEEILDEDTAEPSSDDDDDEASSDDDDSEDDDSEEEEEKKDDREVVVVKVASAKLYEEPSSDSDSIDSASEGSKLFVIERDGKWIKVENPDGESGWVRASKVEEDGGEDGPGYRYEKFGKRAHAGLGYGTLRQTFTSAGTDPRSNYTISSAAAILSLGGDLLYDYSKKYLIGGDLGYRLHYASPGIRYSDGTNAVNIGYKTHQIDLGVRGGYKLSRSNGMAAYARLGYHYERMGINNVDDFTKNLAYLPSEILSGVTIGGILEVPRLTEKFSMRAGFDYLRLMASRKQTVRLEDGTSSKPMAAWLYGVVQYDWRTDYKITGTYQYTYAKTSWSGMATDSMRPHMSDSANRKDGSHLLMLGLGRSF